MGLFDGLGGISPEMLQMLAILMQGTAESAGAPRTNTIHNLLQFQAMRQKSQQGQQKAQLAAQLGQMFGGGLGPGQQGPPTPYDPNAAAALGIQLGPDYAAQAVHPNLIAQKRLSGAMPSQASVDTDYLTGLGPPPGGYLTTISRKPGAPEMTSRQPTSTGEHRALGISEGGYTGDERIEESKWADVKLPEIKDLYDIQDKLRQTRTRLAQLRFGGPEPSTMIQAFMGSVQAQRAKEKNPDDPAVIKKYEKAQAAFDTLMGESKDPQKDITLMLQDFETVEQMKEVEKKLASPRMENRVGKEIPIGTEYDPFIAQAEERMDELRTQFHQQYGRDPSREELRKIFIGDLLHSSGADKWLRTGANEGFSSESGP